MDVDKEIIPGLRNGTRTWSPITMNNEWSTLVRLIIVVFFACFGATLSGYYLSAFFVERELRRLPGYIYQGCIGLSDMLITGGIVPIAAVVLLSGVWDLLSVCWFLQTLAAASTYSYSIFFVLLAAEVSISVFKRDPSNKICACEPFIIVAVFLFSFTLASIGTYMRYDYDYCERKHYGNFYFRTITTVLLHGTCFCLTVVPLIAARFRVQHLKRHRQVEYKLFSNVVRLNLSVYLVYVAGWSPYLVIVYQYPNSEDIVYYYCAWVGIGRPLVTSVIYGFMNSTFGKVYGSMFFYCCCKTSLYNYNTPRARRNAENPNHARAGTTNIHIMQTAVNPHSPQRASTSTREALEL